MISTSVMVRRRGQGIVLAALVSFTGSGGCGDGSTGASSSSAAAGGPTPASASASALVSAAPPFDAKAFCDRLCKRSVACGIARVEGLARAGDATDKKALEKSVSERSDVEQTCATECIASPPAAADETRVKAEACLALEDCAAYWKCTEGLTSSP